MSFLEKLKSRWGVKSNFQILVICLVFALTGMSTVEIRKIIFPLIGVTEVSPFWLKSIYWLFLIFPSYYVFMLFYGYIFGQWKFFWMMFKKTFGRFGKMFGGKKVEVIEEKA